jgi:hypothetical protein
MAVVFSTTFDLADWTQDAIPNSPDPTGDNIAGWQSNDTNANSGSDHSSSQLLRRSWWQGL